MRAQRTQFRLESFDTAKVLRVDHRQSQICGLWISESNPGSVSVWNFLQPKQSRSNQEWTVYVKTSIIGESLSL